MATCPFAQAHPISGGCGGYTGGPFRIVHHTTEGHTADEAFAAFAQHGSDPHFTVDQAHIYQHIDTAQAARALRHPSGAPETNRDSAVQIEVVGFAGAAKDPKTLRNVARLCRWLEQQHDIPRTWPNGPPQPAVNGADPGGHNRDLQTWTTEGGHYGHSHVPENTHWDPAYTKVELRYLMTAEFDAAGQPTNLHDPAVQALGKPLLGAAPAAPPQVMTDHADIGEDAAASPPPVAR